MRDAKVPIGGLVGLVNVHVCSLRNSNAHPHFAKMAVWR